MKSVILATLLPLASAHWTMSYPTARNQGDEDNLPKFPCGGVDTPLANRTRFPLNGPIQLKISHTSYNVQVFLALGENPGSAFNTVLLPTVAERGPNNFCIGAGALQFPSNLNITEGTLGTIQVVTNADGSTAGGLYNCADVIFTTTPLSTADYNANCQNSTGVTATTLSPARNANETNGGTSSSSSSMSSGMSGMTMTGTGTAASTGAASTSSSRAWAAQATAAGWGMAALGVAAGVLAM